MMLAALRRYRCGKRGHPFVDMTVLRPESAFMWEYTCKCSERVEIYSYAGPEVRRIS